jgi:hypothetical protein
MAKPAIVYGLTSTEDGQIRYIGQTIKPLNKRLRSHIDGAKRGGTWPVAKWIRKVIRQVFTVQIVPLVETAIWNDTEIETIAVYLAQGAKLLNATNGGQNPVGLVFSEETRRKMSDAAKRRWSGPEARTILAEIARQAWTDPDYRAHMSAQLKARLGTPGARARLSAQISRAWQDPDLQPRFKAAAKKRAKVPSFRRKISEATKRRWQDPAYREKMRAEYDRRQQDVTLKGKIARSVKALWEDPVYRERLIASHQASWTPAKRAKQAKTLNGRTLPKEHKQHISEGLRQHYADPAVRARRSETLKKGWETRRQRQAQHKEP